MSTTPARAVSIPDAARLLACSQSTVRRAIEAGQIREVRLGRIVRIPITEIDRLLAPTTAREAP